MTAGGDVMQDAAAYLRDRADRGTPTLLSPAKAQRLAEWLDDAAGDPADLAQNNHLARSNYLAYAFAAALTDAPIPMASA